MSALKKFKNIFSKRFSKRGKIVKKICKSVFSLAIAAVLFMTACSVETKTEGDTYVKIPVETVVIKANAKSVNVGGAVTLTAEITPANAYYDSIEWTSSDESVFSISNSGFKAVALSHIDEESAAASRYSDVTVTIGGVKSGELQLNAYSDGVNVPDDEQTAVETNPEDSEKEEPDPTPTPTPTPGGEGKQGTGMTGSTGEGTITSSASVTITRVVGWLESAYLEWTPVSNASYTVEYKKSDASEWTAIDTPLIRNYDGFIRADIPGLSHGDYEFKVAANGGTPATASASVASHDRCGYAFTSDTLPGAYKADGTLKDGAIVIYVDNDNFNTVALEINKNAKGEKITLTGVQAIVNNSGYCKYASYNNNVPVCIRVIGKIDTTGFPKSSWGSSAEGLQVKGTGKVDTMFTIEGVGDDATLWGFGILCRDSHYVELRNLGFMCFADDGISLDTSNLYTWVHNCDIFYGSTGGDSDQAKGDGSLDVKGDSKYQTYSYNHFWDSGKMSLCGMKSESGPNYITYHHNWFDHSDSRHPRIRTMTVHIYNNYYDGNSKYGTGATTGADAFVEANYFRNVKFPMMSSLQGNDVYAGSSKYDPANYGTFSSEAGGSIKSYNNKIVDTLNVSSYWPHKNSKQTPLITKGVTGSLPAGVDTSVHFDAWEASSRNEQVPSSVTSFSGSDTYSNFDTASDFYGYSVQTPDEAKTTVMTYAGRIENGDFEFAGYGHQSTDSTNASKDTDYSVDTALKAAVVGYTSTLVSVYGISEKAVY